MMRSRLRHHRPLALAGLAWLLAAAVTAPAAESPSADEALARALALVSGSRMAADVARLSGSAFNGRQTGTADDRRSAQLVAAEWAAAGLLPAGVEPIPGEAAPSPVAAAVGPWALTEPVLVTQIQPDCRLELTLGLEVVTARPGTDFLPVLDSPSVGAAAPVVFVGYGISDPAHDLDEYEGVDVRNRVVLFLRGKPEGYAGTSSQADKERTARARGAVAYLTAVGPLLSPYEARRGVTGEPVAAYNLPEGERPLPGAWISTDLAVRLLAAQGLSLREIQEALAQRRRPRSVALAAQARLRWTSVQEPGQMVNVLGLLPGRDPSARGETVALGAHRDHFGRQAGLLFPGADDNASGTAVLLEVARALREAGVAPRRSLLFLSFSGEEQGLLGSRAYVRRPTRALAGTRAMVNVDHAGVGNGRLTVGLTQITKDLAFGAGQTAGLGDRLDLFGYFPGGDHVPFAEATVPTATVVSSGVHPHFHRPTDRVETVKPELLEAAARYVLALLWTLAEAP